MDHVRRSRELLQYLEYLIRLDYLSLKNDMKVEGKKNEKRYTRGFTKRFLRGKIIIPGKFKTEKMTTTEIFVVELHELCFVFVVS